MNILLLTADSLRCDRTSLFDHRRDTTPFLSDLAGRGFEFRRVYANGRNTAASFPAIHTSTYGSYYDGIGIPDSGTPTIAELLHNEGYQTHGINTNELVSRDYNYDRGFDFYHDSRSSDDDSGLRTQIRDLIGDGSLFDLTKKAHFLSTEYLGVKIFDTADAVSGFGDQILEWTTRTDEDWFVWAHYMNPHHPYEPPEECQKALSLNPVSGREATSLSRKMRLHPAEVTEKECETLRGLYDASVLSWDREIESTYHRLEKAGELENTLIIITADHGELLGEDGLYGHPPTLNQPLLRVPLIFAGDCVEAGETGVQVGLIDLAPTVASLIGAEVPGGYHGESLYTSGEGFRDAGGMIQLSETDDPKSPLIAAIDGGQKVIYHRDDTEWKGYTLSEIALQEDPVETVDDNLRNAIHEHEMRGNTERQSGAVVDQQQLKEDLQALGYME